MGGTWSEEAAEPHESTAGETRNEENRPSGLRGKRRSEGRSEEDHEGDETFELSPKR